MRRWGIAAAVLALGVASCGAPPAARHTAYVDDEQANVVHVIDGATAKEVARIPVGARPRGMALSHDGRQLYVAAGNANRIDVVDLASRKVVGAFHPAPTRNASW